MIRSMLRNWWPLAAVAILLALVSVAAAHSSPEIVQADRPTGVGATEAGDVPPTGEVHTEEPVKPAGDGTAEIPGWISLLASLLCGITVLVGAGLLGWALVRDVLRRRAGRMPAGAAPASAGETAVEVVAALDAGLVDLSDSDADPRRAVIACWVRMEQAAAAAGVPRRVGDTPTDLVARLLTTFSTVSADVLAAFADVYREARYATHTVDERMRGQARSALRRLRGELTSEVAG